MNNRVSLGELLTLERRPVKVMPDGQYQEIGIYCFGRGIFHKTPRSGVEVGDKDLFQIRDGDFILQVTFAWEGAVALASRADDGLYGSVRFPTFRVDEAKCYSPFLVHYFRTPEGREQLTRICPGSAGRNRVLSIKRIPEVTVPLPPLSEQRRIVAKIDALAAKIEEARALRTKSQQALELLCDVGASRVFDEATRFGTRRLRELVRLQGGGTPSKSNPLYWGGSIPWISPKDMKRPELNDATDHITDAAVANSATSLVAPGAVLVVVRGMILAHTVPVALLRVPATINQDMKAMLPVNCLRAEYLRAALWAWNDRIVKLVEKSTHDTRKLETDKLLDFEIPVPPIQTQQAIVAQVNCWREKADTVSSIQSQTAAELDALLPAILDRAFRGEL